MVKAGSFQEERENTENFLLDLQSQKDIGKGR